LLTVADDYRVQNDEVNGGRGDGSLIGKLAVAGDDENRPRNVSVWITMGKSAPRYFTVYWHRRSVKSALEECSAL
jgi:hypothetical protein